MPSEPTPAPAATNPDPLLTIAEIAELFQRAIGTVEYWRHNGDLPAPDETLGRTPGWRRSTLLRWGMQTGRMTPDGTPVRGRPRAVTQAR